MFFFYKSDGRRRCCWSKPLDSQTASLSTPVVAQISDAAALAAPEDAAAAAVTAFFFNPTNIFDKISIRYVKNPNLTLGYLFKIPKIEYAIKQIKYWSGILSLISTARYTQPDRTFYNLGA